MYDYLLKSPYRMELKSCLLVSFHTSFSHYYIFFYESLFKDKRKLLTNIYFLAIVTSFAFVKYLHHVAYTS
jgi:hypothetical protein